jgi:hypothetical protein
MTHCHQELRLPSAMYRNYRIIIPDNTMHNLLATIIANDVPSLR